MDHLNRAAESTTHTFHYSTLLYSSVDHIKGPRATAGAIHLPPAIDEDATTHDANSYQKFRSVDEAIASQIRRLEKQAEYQPGLQDSELACFGFQLRPVFSDRELLESVTFASCLTKALCCKPRVPLNFDLR